MNDEEKNLLKVQLVLNYYKKDITDRYMRCIENIVLDNDVLNVFDERVYITTLDKYNKLQHQNEKYKEVIDKAIKCVYYNTKYRNGADIYQFVDIESEILEPLQDILEQNDNSNNAYLKEFNDWLKEVE